MIPLNSNIDMKPVTNNDLETLAYDDKEKEWEYETRRKFVPANQLREHKIVFLQESLKVNFRNKTITHQVQG